MSKYKRDKAYSYAQALRDISRFANILDQKGLVKEADMADSILRKYANPNPSLKDKMNKDLLNRSPAFETDPLSGRESLPKPANDSDARAYASKADLEIKDIKENFARNSANLTGIALAMAESERDSSLMSVRRKYYIKSVGEIEGNNNCLVVFEGSSAPITITEKSENLPNLCP